MIELLIPLAVLFFLWVLTGWYMACKYQEVIKKVGTFRENIKSHVMENGTTDEELYKLVIDESRNILPDYHVAVKAHQSKNS